MTQSPYGETASPKFAQGSGSDFGATTISGTPASTTATEQRSGSGSTTRPEDTNYRQSGTQQASPAASAAAAAARPARARGPRRARLQLRHISPLTVLKFSCVLAIALFFVWLIIVGVLYGILDAAGVVDNVNSAYTNLSGPGTKAPITAGIVFGGAAIIGVVNIILFVALTTIGSVIYNLCADLVGGIEITLSER